MLRPLAWPSSLLLLTALLLPAGAQPHAEAPIVVPEGEVWTVPSGFTAGSLAVLGTLRAAAPGDLTLHAGSLRVGPQGLIEALPGAAGADAEGSRAVGGDGADGGGVTIVADLLVVEEGGWVLAGRGGDGGNAAASTLAQGGAGGAGGSVRLLARSTSLHGHVVPGAGGHGGAAVASGASSAEALGGDGGSVGRAFLGARLGFDLANGPLPPAPPSSLAHGAASSMSVVPPCPTPLPVPAEKQVGVPGVPGTPEGGAGGRACAVSQGPDGADGVDCGGGSALVTPGEAGGQATATATGGRGGDGTGRGAPGGAGEAYAYGGDGGDGGSGSPCGRPGAPGGAGSAAYAQGNGGTGGIALVSAVLTGGSGGDGGLGRAWAECGDGGRGGSGVSPGAGPGGGRGGNGGGATGTDGACEAEATGGKAGAGDPPGADGNFDVKATGGNGGDGGAGNSPGGAGGNGGNTLAIAHPPELDGTLGTGVAAADPGSGGDGGPGDPEGADGVDGADLSPGSSPPAVSPGGQGLLAQSWPDVAAGFDFGAGAGLYDPLTPNHCLALVNAYQGFSPVLLYHVGLRYWAPAAGQGPVPLGLAVPDPSNCAGLVPNDHLAADHLAADAGGAFWSQSLLGATEVVSLAASAIWVNYCTAPTANVGIPAVEVVAGTLSAFAAESLNCGGAAGSHTLFPGCATLPASTQLGEFNLDNPVFLRDGGCNTLQGAPAGVDYAVQHCVSVDVFDVVAGPQGVQTDEDHFVVLGNGGLAPWALTVGSPASQFPNVSGFEGGTSTC